MSMKPPMLNAAMLAAVCAGLLPAADAGLLNLVMPDAKVLAGINVDQAKTTPFGVYMLSQIQAQGAQHLQQVAALTGFDPTRDLHELLIASNATPGSHTGLVLARGNFDPSKIQSAAVAGGGTTTTYNGVTLILDPKQKNAVAFLDATLAVAGDVASVKSAIDRQTAPAPISASLAVQVNNWSTTEDAWGVAATPLSALKPPATPPNPQAAALLSAVQNIQQAAGGVKFGDPIVFTGQAQADTADNATAMAGVLQFLVSMAQLQAQQKNPQLAAILPTLSVTTSANLVNLSMSVPESQAEQVAKPKPAAAPQFLHHGPRHRGNPIPR
jgi:hypothetical protein